MCFRFEMNKTFSPPTPTVPSPPSATEQTNDDDQLANGKRTSSSSGNWNICEDIPRVINSLGSVGDNCLLIAPIDVSATQKTNHIHENSSFRYLPFGHPSSVTSNAFVSRTNLLVFSPVIYIKDIRFALIWSFFRFASRNKCAVDGMRCLFFTWMIRRRSGKDKIEAANAFARL